MFGMPNIGYNYSSHAPNNGLNGNGTGNGKGVNEMGNGVRGMAKGEGMTPGARSVGEHSTGTVGTAGTDEKDPFLSLLEQLAENEHSRGGPSELDFFLSGSQG